MSEYRFSALCPPDFSLCLASASPRRRRLLTGMGIRFTVYVSHADESLPDGTLPDRAVLLLARRKAEAAAAALPDGTAVLAADTLVACDGRILGKPRSEAEADDMLRLLCGRAHSVYTGVCLLYGGRAFCGCRETTVYMRATSEDERTAYIQTGEPMDKAGAYGIQGLGGQLVERIDGDFDNVVGLPTGLVDELLCDAFLHRTPSHKDTGTGNDPFQTAGGMTQNEILE